MDGFKCLVKSDKVGVKMSEYLGWIRDRHFLSFKGHFRVLLTTFFFLKIKTRGSVGGGYSVQQKKKKKKKKKINKKTTTKNNKKQQQQQQKKQTKNKLPCIGKQ